MKKSLKSFSEHDDVDNNDKAMMTKFRQINEMFSKPFIFTEIRSPTGINRAARLSLPLSLALAGSDSGCRAAALLPFAQSNVET